MDDPALGVRRHGTAPPRALLLLLVAAATGSQAQPAPSPASGRAVAAAAERQVGITTRYDASYQRLRYPGGDVPIERGVCSDVVVRAFRAIGVDLQVELHEDMRRHFGAYPRNWGLARPDRNIDHRRVPNLMTWFTRRDKALPLDAAYEPGDVVAWRLPNGLHHIGLVSTRQAPGAPNLLVVHNIGSGAQLEDVLHAYAKLGHYRW
jgi:uncharacterized protein YijF (DUF1287 family)